MKEIYVVQETLGFNPVYFSSLELALPCFEEKVEKFRQTGHTVHLTCEDDPVEGEPETVKAAYGPPLNNDPNVIITNDIIVFVSLIRQPLDTWKKED